MSKKYTKKINYIQSLNLSGLLFNQKKANEGHKFLSARLCKKLEKYFEDEKKILTEYQEDYKIDTKNLKFKIPNECEESKVFEFTGQELLVIGDCIADVFNGEEHNVKTGTELIPLIETLGLEDYIDKHTYSKNVKEIELQEDLDLLEST